MEVETHGIGMTRNFAWSAIEDQASGWKQGVREGGQNGLDAPNSTEVRINYNVRHTTITDDGDGRDLSDDTQRSLFLDLGETTKKGDDNAVGEFGLGKGQMWAVGVTKIVSGRQALIYDVKRRGISRNSVTQITLPEEHAVDGTMVVMYHYDGQVPDKGSREWDKFEDSLTNRFSYTSQTLGKDVFINGELVSDESVRETVEDKSFSEYEACDDARIALAQDKYGDISVYSNGIYVKDISGEGFCGTVVTDENLSLDISRNDIKDDCELWDDVKSQIDDVKLSLIESIPSEKMNRRARKTAAKMMNESDNNKDRLEDKAVFGSINDKLVSLSQIQERDRVAFADADNVYADKVRARGECVLDKTDSATKTLTRATSSLSTPPKFDVEEVAKDEMGVDEGYVEINDLELTPWQSRRLGVARKLASLMDYGRYTILWGEDEEAAAWTDGSSKVVITESVFKASELAAWLPDLYDTLCHEFAHNTSNKGSATHDRRFKARAYEIRESNIRARRRMAELISEKGLSEFEVGNTRNARKRARELHDRLPELSEGQEFYKNRDGRCSTVIEADEFRFTFKGPRGGEWVVDLARNRSEAPVARRYKTDSEQEITHLSLKK